MAYKQKLQKKRWISTSVYRGYSQPPYAVLGSSDTGMWSDSPCPSDKVKAELSGFRAFLRSKGIGSTIKTARSSNLFMFKRWVVVPKEDFAKAKKLADQYLKEKEKETSYIHEAD
jgi:hypothetical protein